MKLTALTGIPKNLFTFDHTKEKGIPPSRLKDQSILQIQASSRGCCSMIRRLVKLLRARVEQDSASVRILQQMKTCLLLLASELMPQKNIAMAARNHPQSQG